MLQSRPSENSNRRMAITKGSPPVLLFSHGTTMLTGEDSHIREYWLHHGNKALEYGIKGIIIMVCGRGHHIKSLSLTS